MRIAVVQPDWHIAGGFERVVARLTRALTAAGHEVTHCAVDVPALPRAAFGLPVPAPVWDAQPEFFRYLAMLDGFRQMDLRSHDLVLSTQPPSFGVEHPRHLSLFYHHVKVYYDLSDVYLASGMADPGTHRQAEGAVRRIDTPLLQGLGRILAPSQAVRDRLATHNGVNTGIGPFLAGPAVAPADDLGDAPMAGTHVLCVSRHEFAKRSELFVHAMKYLTDIPAVVTGDGGRLPFARSLDRRLGHPGTNLDAITPADLWCNDGIVRNGDSPAGPRRVTSSIRFAGHVGEDELHELYRAAICVVAPAYSEDYGLTAIEAMAHSRPLIVTNDGGGLLDFVEDGVTGFVTEPTGAAIAAAVRRLIDNPDLAARMGAAAREREREYTWERAFAQLSDGIDQVMSA